ncbi:MAG: aminotransferase class I/II-fold pyridoxal phosphate-dependent enzyme [Actinomycetota bacterium]|nr:aminotransferase class I/II-fold pyridoxal phosphate-dependent enzyme [Actinomycetota bacterium]
MVRTSRKAAQFTESVIREMTRLAALHSTPQRPVVNLAQGFPDFAAPSAVKEAARQAIADDVNQYAVTWGAPAFREALAGKYARHYGWTVDPDTELTVTCGATEGMIASLLAVIDPGDEVVVFEPFYENYGPDAVLSGAVPSYVALDAADGFTLDVDRLRAAVTPRTRGIVVNSPNNPTGKVFTTAELEAIRDVCVEHDLVAFTDEIYEHIVYDGATHTPLALIDGMAERTCTVNALSKTYSVTGWRVGWVVAPADLTGAVRKVHDFLTVGAAAPLQAAGAVAAGLDDDYYAGLGAFYRERRDYLVGVLRDVGLEPVVPRGAYYTMVDCSPFAASDVEFAKRLVTELGVACVPGSSFYSNPALGAGTVRFAFCKQRSTLEAAAERLDGLRHW